MFSIPKLSLLLTTIILLFASQVISQPFAEFTNNITDIGRSEVAWGDYDNDGDLDIAVCGETYNGVYTASIFMNAEGAFVDIEANLPAAREGSLEWGDFDNDNDLDLLMTGETLDSGNVSLIYRNDDGIFTEYDAGLPLISHGDAAWGDYDGDGDLDIMISGSWEVKLFENVDGVFMETENDFGYLQYSKIAWGDFDNDGDLDILLSGDTGGGYLADIYINNKGTFERAYLEITGLFSGSADLVDYDNDGDLDIAITGFNDFFEPQFHMYNNLGNMTIEPFYTVLEGIAVSGVDWGDYDNDGDLDLVMAGKNASCGSSLAKVYRNDNGFFVTETGAQMSGAIRCSVAWADFDNDGDLDYILNGMTLSETPFTKLYRNEAGSNEFSVNTNPLSPSTLLSEVDMQNVLMRWEKASDNETPQDGLNYNLRIGTTPGGSDIVSPMATNESGFRLLQALGNVNSDTSWMIKGLPEGTYYWSVQSIDQAYSGSPFAEEQSFTILETGLPELNDQAEVFVYPNPASNMIYINTGDEGVFEISIFNITGQNIYSNTIMSGKGIDISDLDKGTYIIRINYQNQNLYSRLIKN